jgi:hypothetical protein
MTEQNDMIAIGLVVIVFIIFLVIACITFSFIDNVIFYDPPEVFTVIGTRI